MARRRFFVKEVHDGITEIEGEEARHLTQVLRVEPGQLFELSDNEALYLGQIDVVGKSEVKFRIVERLPDPPEPIPVHLFVSLFKFDRLELLLEKATELGVASVTFVPAERSEKGLERAAEKRIERWRRIVTEASQQSRRMRLPKLYGPMRFNDALRSNEGLRLILDEDRRGGSLIDVLHTTPASVALMAGPEGGWSEHERQKARDAAWVSISLGTQVLRAETAAIAALAVVNGLLRQ